MNKFEILQKTFVTPSMKQKVETAVLDCIYTAQKHYGADKIRVIPEVRYNTKGMTAGLCGYNSATNEHWIDINPILLNENEREMISETVPHEMAHCIVNQLYPTGRKKLSGYEGYFGKVEPHGWEWASVMRLFGLQPDRCHKMDVSTIQSMKNGGVEHQYKCGCMVHKLSKIKHNRMKTNPRSYYCKLCGKGLVFDKTVNA